MKKVSQIFEAKAALDIQDDVINYISKTELEKYLKKTDKFTLPETKNIIQWLIDNNASYIKQLGGKNSKNALKDFYDNGAPKDENLKELYKWIGIVNKANRLLEIPVFQTEEQFEGILSGKIALDEIVLDLVSEKGRNACVKKYDALIHKVCNKWLGKSSLDYDELYSNALLGFTWAMNAYGKPSATAEKEMQKQIEDAKKSYEAGDTDETPEEAEKRIKKEWRENSGKKTTTFQSYAWWRMEQAILGAIENESQTVRIPKSQQRKQRDEQGFNARYNSVSGEKPLGDGENDKTLFDIVGGQESATRELTKREATEAYDRLLKAVENKFGEKTTWILKNWMKDSKDKTKLKGSEVCKKYGYRSEASVTAEINKVIKWIKSDKNAYELAKDALDMLRESQIEDDDYNNTGTDSVHVGMSLKKEATTGLNNVDD